MEGGAAVETQTTNQSNVNHLNSNATAATDTTSLTPHNPGESSSATNHDMSTSLPPQSEQGGTTAATTTDTDAAGAGATGTSSAAGAGVAPHGMEPVNFNPRSDPYHPSRRVTIGGSMHANSGKMDHRNSLSSMSFNMDEFFGPGAGRRGSMAGDSAFPESLLHPGRRDSLDSSTAALDAALYDITRRRLSMAPSFPQDPYTAAADWARTSSLDLSQRSAGHAAGAGMGGTAAGMMNSFPGAYPNAGFGAIAQAANMPLAAGSLAERQQQLQAQQRMLEQQQRELELQRQELIASMQQRNAMMNPDPYARVASGAGAVGAYGSPSASDRQRAIGSLGLGSVQSGGSGSEQPPPVSSQGYGNQGSGANATAGGGGSQQWWICQVCNTKAFASHDEALRHEAVCQGGSNRGSHPYGGTTSMRDTSSARRNYSLGMDSSQHTTRTTGTLASYEIPRYSSGPFAMMDKPTTLSMTTDKEWLTPLHCFVRRHCVEVFTATEKEVAAPSKGKRKPIQVGQIGIRCPHCHSSENTKARERGSVYYPTTIASIYNATMNLLQRHLHSCPCVPTDIMRRYETLKADDARSGTSKRYWIESALSLGLVDTENGIRFSALEPPPLPSLTRSQESMVDSMRGQSARRNSNDFFSSSSNAVTDESKANTEDAGSAPTEQALTETAPLTAPEDKSYSTAFSYHLLSQMQPCVFTEADRLGKRKGLPPGFPGLACRHCFGGYGSGRFFPSSIKTLSDTSKTLNVLHNHMMRCRKCPPDVRETLEKLRGSHDEERAKMKFGSQKAFFARIWERLHGPNAQPVKTPKRKMDQQASPAHHAPQARQNPPPQTGAPPELSHAHPPPAALGGLI